MSSFGGGARKFSDLNGGGAVLKGRGKRSSMNCNLLVERNAIMKLR